MFIIYHVYYASYCYISCLFNICAYTYIYVFMYITLGDEASQQQTETVKMLHTSLQFKGCSHTLI